jgi:hypothetical protein
VTGPDIAHRLGRLRDDGAGLRKRLAEVANSIANTEDQVAETLERMAVGMPEESARLRARAARARHIAGAERGWAAKFGQA